MNYRMTYNGHRKVTAIKLIRCYTGHRLKDCMDALKNPNGIIVTARDAEQIVMSYLEEGMSPFVDRLNAFTLVPYNAGVAHDFRPETKR